MENVTKLKIHSYDEWHDTFTCTVTPSVLAPVKNCVVPAILMPHLTGISCDPNEIVGKTYKLSEAFE